MAESIDHISSFFQRQNLEDFDAMSPIQEDWHELVSIMRSINPGGAPHIFRSVGNAAAAAASRYASKFQEEPEDAIDHILVWTEKFVLACCRAVQQPAAQLPSLPIEQPQAGSLLSPCGSFSWPSLPSTAASQPTSYSFVSSTVLTSSLAGLMPTCFDTITQWPDSRPAASAWAQAIKREPGLRAPLISALQSAFQLRLLRAAVPTQTVLDVYSLALACLLHIDPSGIVCDAATEPVQSVLKQRDDTIKCVVTALTAPAAAGEACDSDNEQDGTPGLSGAAADLKAALAATPDAAKGIAPGVLTQSDREFTTSFKGIPSGLTVSQRKGSCMQVSSASVTQGQIASHLEGRTWLPESREMTTGGVSASRSDDLIGTLTALYGTAELFIGEFRGQLRDRLLAMSSFDVEEDIAVLELLKMRFGDAALHSAEVMLNDIADSKRALAAVRRECPATAEVPTGLETLQGDESAQMDAALSPMLVSEHYWPALKRGPAVVDENAVVQQADPDDHSVPTPCPMLHPALQSKYDEFASTWEALKAPRHLRWQHHLGRMTVSVAPPSGGSAVQVTSSPLAVSVLLYVNDAEPKMGCLVVDIAQAMSIQPSTVLKLAKVWQRQGVLQLVGSGEESSLTVVQVGDDHAFNSAAGAAAVAEDDEELSDEARERMAMCEQFIYGMLRNMGTLQLAMIHNNLKMFMSMGDGAGKSTKCLAGSCTHRGILRRVH